MGPVQSLCRVGLGGLGTTYLPPSTVCEVSLHINLVNNAAFCTALLLLLLLLQKWRLSGPRPAGAAGVDAAWDCDMKAT